MGLRQTRWGFWDAMAGGTGENRSGSWRKLMRCGLWLVCAVLHQVASALQRSSDETGLVVVESLPVNTAPRPAPSRAEPRTWKLGIHMLQGPRTRPHRGSANRRRLRCPVRELAIVLRFRGFWFSALWPMAHGRHEDFTPLSP
jgi:hypothetical protein